MPDRVQARGPGRVNLIGEHTDYNDGLALPFAIDRGVTVTAEARDDGRVRAEARDLAERDEFELDAVERAKGWRAFVRGTVAELQEAGHTLRPCTLTIEGDLPHGSGLSSSAALEAALSLALLGLAGEEPGDRVELAKLCSRVENDWVGAETGLLDQLSALCGEDGKALEIDFRTLQIELVPLELGDWRLYTLDSGAAHEHAGGGYNERRAECRAVCEHLNLTSLRDVTEADLARLPEPLNRRARHVLTENARVEATAQALAAHDLDEVATLLDASHASLRDDYEASVPEVEATVARLEQIGARGARMVGGGFGGAVLALFGPGGTPPEGAVPVSPGPGASLLL
jgi:galactokinase